MTHKRYFLLAGILAFIGLVGVSCSIYSENYPTVTLTSAPVTQTPVATQPPTDTPTQTATPYFIPLGPTSPPSPTAMPPYPTASVVKSNAVAFIAENSLWVANVDGSGERKLTDIGNNVSWRSNYLLQWSPDGKWISYISGDDLWIISPDGSVKRKVLLISKANKNRIESYSWSPDDSKIAYIDSTSGSPMPRLLDLNIGDISEPLLGTPQFSVSWSPDGRYILLNTYASLTIFEVATSKVLKEINSACPMWHGEPVWSPDNKWFYNPVYATGIYNMSICISGVDGSTKQIHSSSSSRLPAWDKTGRFLYFTTQDTKQRLVQYNVRTQETKIILVLEASEASMWSVSVSPEGHILEMDGTISGNLQSFIFMNLDSLSATRFKISEIPYSLAFFDTTFWSADSQNIILLSNGYFYKLDIQTGKTTIISGKHSIESWVISPIATTP